LKAQAYELKKFRPEDLPRVMYINAVCLPENYSEFFYRSLYEEFPDTFIVATVDSLIVGYVMCRMERGFSELNRWKLTRKGHVVSIAVLPEYRRMGIGRSLMISAMKGMKGYGMRECFLEVRVSNEPAIRLYKSLGFEVVRTIQAFYRDGEAANVMAVDLEGLRI